MVLTKAIPMGITIMTYHLSRATTTIMITIMETTTTMVMIMGMTTTMGHNHGDDHGDGHNF